MKFTMFRSKFDKDKVDSDRSWPELCERAKAPREYPHKDAMPLIKFALFGNDIRSAEGYLRNNANMRSITGVEGDYDAGRLTPEDACTNLGMAGVSALVYTTPSYSPEAPRWRVLAPLSADRPKDERTGLLGRINGVLGGVLAPESFVPAQSYYWGRVAGGRYLALEARGTYVDTLAGLDAGAAYPPGRDVVTGASTVTDSELRRVVVEGVPGEVYQALVKLSARLVGRGMDADDALAVLHGLLTDCAWRERDPVIWQDRMNDCVTLCASAARRYTDRRERPVLTLVPAVAEERARIEIVQTGLLVPTSVSSSPEVELRSLDGVLPTPARGIYPNSLYVGSAIARASLNGRLWLDLSTRLPMNGSHLLSDIDSIRLTRQIGSIPGAQGIRDITMFKAMLALAHDNEIDPWCDWLKQLQWDGVVRLNTLASTYFGVVVGDDALENIMLRKLMVAVVARQFHPGAKFDAMLVLEGAQGIRKSSALRVLFGNPYVASWEHDFNTKDFRQQLQGNICIEVAELASFQRSEMNAIKSILSETTDVFRPSYGRTVERRPRRCVIIGTSNSNAYLTDDDGNRRFWPMVCTRVIDTDALEHDREQIFAEAVVAFRAAGTDAQWWALPGRVADEQADRMVVDPWLPVIEDYLSTLVGDVKSEALLIRPLNIPVRDQTMPILKRVAGILRRLGYRKIKSDGKMVWRRIEGPSANIQGASGGPS
jgi:hypothetical protein